MKLVVAVDNKWAIGNKGGLLVHIPEDMKQFKELTTGHVVVLGRKTLATFPGGRPLPNRTNVVLTRGAKIEASGLVCASGVEEVLELAKEYGDDEIYIIGGSSVYRQFMPYVDTAYVTYINYSYEADAYFPNLDEDESWELCEESGEKTYFDLEYTFRKYRKKY